MNIDEARRKLRAAIKAAGWPGGYEIRTYPLLETGDGVDIEGHLADTSWWVGPGRYSVTLFQRPTGDYRGSLTEKDSLTVTIEEDA